MWEEQIGAEQTALCGRPMLTSDRGNFGLPLLPPSCPESRIDFRKFFQLSSVRVGAGNTRGNSGYLNVEEPIMAKTVMHCYVFFSYTVKC